MKASFVKAALFLATTALAAPFYETVADAEARTAVVDFYDPRNGGGSWLDQSAGLGEPINVSSCLPSSRCAHLNKGIRWSYQAKARLMSSPRMASIHSLKQLASQSCDFIFFSCDLTFKSNHLHLCSSPECLGLHSGDPQLANLGDGHGALGEMVSRFRY